ncbi:hypothetical protein BV898_07956 [Hypsibius exemplaris]|uniref:Macroglobulin domain-containing protein n=1 Tax=Hypsibius exemplaris TaxID=2072580 RepID=A0A1W0WS45_HYPEX|nr:hypothetical protein BV898_07956 [Hypsibius exemplaris]
MPGLPNEFFLPGVAFFPQMASPESHSRQTHLIVVSKKIRGGQAYKLQVSVLRDAHGSLDLTATIKWNGSSLVTGKHTFSPSSCDLFPLKVKANLLAGSYELVVEGHFRDGGGTAFKYRTALELESRSVNIVIRTDKPIYRQEDIG